MQKLHFSLKTSWLFQEVCTYLLLASFRNREFVEASLSQVRTSVLLVYCSLDVKSPILLYDSLVSLSSTLHRILAVQIETLWQMLQYYRSLLQQFSCQTIGRLNTRLKKIDCTWISERFPTARESDGSQGLLSQWSEPSSCPSSYVISRVRCSFGRTYSSWRFSALLQRDLNSPCYRTIVRSTQVVHSSVRSSLFCFVLFNQCLKSSVIHSKEASSELSTATWAWPGVYFSSMI